MSRKYKQVCKTQNYVEHLLILASANCECISNSAFASAIGLKICAITTGIRSISH